MEAGGLAHCQCSGLRVVEEVVGKARDRGGGAMRIENTNGRLPKAVRGADVRGDGDPVAVFPGVAQERLEALPDVRAVARQACPGGWPLMTVAHGPLVGVTRREVADGFESLAVGRRDRSVAVAFEIAQRAFRRGALRQSPGKEECRGSRFQIAEEGGDKSGGPGVSMGAYEEKAGTRLGNAVVVGPEDRGCEVVVSTESLGECCSEIDNCRVVGSTEVVLEPQDILQEHQARPDEFDELEIGLEQEVAGVARVASARVGETLTRRPSREEVHLVCEVGQLSALRREQLAYIPRPLRDAGRPIVGEPAAFGQEIRGQGLEREGVLLDRQEAAPPGSHEAEAQPATAGEGIDECGRRLRPGRNRAALRAVRAA